MNTWQRVWRLGLAPCLPDRGLEALADALRNDDPKLLQNVTTDVPPLANLENRTIQGACALGFCGWRGLGLRTLREVARFFEVSCRNADRLLGESAAVRHFLDWYDGTPRYAMRGQLLAEVSRELQRRRRLAA